MDGESTFDEDLCVLCQAAASTKVLQVKRGLQALTDYSISRGKRELQQHLQETTPIERSK